jgi:transcriptional antiterminator RfaH
MIPEGRYGVRRKNDIPVAPDTGQFFNFSIHPPCMNQDAAREWFAIRTKPQQEQVAKLHYQRQGYGVYLPMMRTIVRHARRTEEKLKPFFPGYLFLYLAPLERNWVAISSTRGALGPICFGDQYVPVPDWIIADLQAKEDGNGGVPLAELQKKGLTRGAKVAVQLDDDTSAQGLFYSFSGPDNVVVLLSFLNRQVKATLSLDRVQRQ